MNDMTAPTIYACATAPGRAALAVVRVSGPDCQAVLEGFGATCPSPRQASLRRLIHPRTQDLLDEALVLYFAGPHSYTGEDVVELHVHGGAAVVASVLDALAALPACRLAEAGEFTRRAVLHGKLDLTCAEAVADLIDAETTAQQHQALGQLRGNLRDLFDGWRHELHTALAHLEADLEFADEDLPGGIGRAALGALPDLRDKIAGFIGDTRGLQLRAGLRVALLGAPNAGKSSLLNALARRDVAIVTEIAGTTRDLVEVSLDLDGLKVIVTDTAGLRDSSDTVERIGIERALRAAEEADLVLKLKDGSPDMPGFDLADLESKALSVGTKADIAPHRTGEFHHIVSVIDGAGLSALVEDIGRHAKGAVSAASGVLPSRLRQLELLRSCGHHLSLAAGVQQDLELRAEELRLAGDALGRITGAIDVEDLLGVIFSEFCIGK